MATLISSDANAATGFSAGPHSARLGDVFKDLRIRGLPWLEILSKVKDLVTLLSGGGSWQEVLAAILALFGKTP